MTHSAPRIVERDVPADVITGAGLVDRDTVHGEQALIWGDDCVVTAMLAALSTSTQRPRRHVSAA
jgi:hypothetical protein